jgi:hypothetical protein
MGERAAWYLHRLGRMSGPEVARRAADALRKRFWSLRQVRPGSPIVPPIGGTRVFTAKLPPGALEQVPTASRDAVLAEAKELLSGRWRTLGTVRSDIGAPDWFLDPLSGLRAPQRECSFSIDHRSRRVVGDAKQVWELSRHQYVTVLAAAFALSGDTVYAEAAARDLCSWWEANTFLSGIHWTSGIEMAIRLISWVWTRRLLDGWSGAEELFERNGSAVAQIWWHQRYLAAFHSRGSSGNNHAVSESAGLLVASLAFPWFPASERWSSRAASWLVEELTRNTFDSGFNREQAFEYHGFVAELAIVSLVEADLAGRPLPERAWELVSRMVGAIAAGVDEKLGAPRYGDGDSARAVQLLPSGANRWSTLLATGCALFGPLGWWPAVEDDAESVLLAALSRRHACVDGPARKPSHFADGPARRPSHFADCGVTIMRSATAYDEEVWCRCDSGPHGFLSTGAHAHSDALSVEVRVGGVEILADPGTYLYQGEERWRQYFRSTIGHNTVEIGGRDQSVPGGPFMWTRHATSNVNRVTADGKGNIVGWWAEHDGYSRLHPPALHTRSVRLHHLPCRLEVTDRIETHGRHPFRIAFHLGPEVEAALEGLIAELGWPAHEGGRREARLHLPGGAAWTLVRGSEEPVLGWYSPSYGERVPSVTLLGSGETSGTIELRSLLDLER